MAQREENSIVLQNLTKQYDEIIEQLQGICCCTDYERMQKGLEVSNNITYNLACEIENNAVSLITMVRTMRAIAGNKESQRTELPKEQHIDIDEVVEFVEELDDEIVIEVEGVLYPEGSFVDPLDDVKTSLFQLQGGFKLRREEIGLLP